MTFGSAARQAASASARGARMVGVATGRVAGFTFHQARRASRAEGAGDSGLYRLIELNSFQSAGDAAVAISLAGTLFFQVPTDQARGQVALFLGLTMLPFAVMAPLIGPFLDHFRQGRRWAIGATMALRAFLCWVLAGAVASGSLALFPAALGVLVASKAYGVTRAAAVPRLLPEGLSLVRANSRISLSGTVGGAISAPLAVLAAHFGAEWALRYAFLVFVGGTILAVLLPARVDSSQGEEQLAIGMGPAAGAAPRQGGSAGWSEEASARGSRWESGGGAGREAQDGARRGAQGGARRGAQGGARRSALRNVAGRLIRGRVPHSVVLALRSNAALRWMSGFLTMYMAFLLRDKPFPGWETRPALLLGVVVGAAGLGNLTGIALGSLLRSVRPRVTVILVLLVDAAVCVVAAVFYSLLTVLLLALTAGLTQALGKVALDATIQTDVPERTRTSAFARSETLLQLSWVIGGFVGIGLPLVPHLGLGVAAAVLVAGALWVSATARARPRVL